MCYPTELISQSGRTVLSPVHREKTAPSDPVFAEGNKPVNDPLGTQISICQSRVMFQHCAWVTILGTSPLVTRRDTKGVLKHVPKASAVSSEITPQACSEVINSISFINDRERIHQISTTAKTVITHPSWKKNHCAFPKPTVSSFRPAYLSLSSVIVKTMFSLYVLKSLK